MNTYVQNGRSVNQILKTIDRIEAKLERFKSQTNARKTKPRAPKKQTTFVLKKYQWLNGMVAEIDQLIANASKDISFGRLSNDEFLALKQEKYPPRRRV